MKPTLMAPSNKDRGLSDEIRTDCFSGEHGAALDPAAGVAEGWGRLITTAGTPKDVIAKLNAEVQRAVQRPELRQRLIAAGMEPPPPLDPDGFRTFIEADIARWTQFVDAVGVEKLKGDVPQQ
jgi:hypothetical protein